MFCRRVGRRTVFIHNGKEAAIFICVTAIIDRVHATLSDLLRNAPLGLRLERVYVSKPQAYAYAHNCIAERNHRPTCSSSQQILMQFAGISL